jgi:hypothetical protein
LNNSVAAGGKAGGGGTGTSPTAGEDGGPGIGGDLFANTFEGPEVSVSASILGDCAGTPGDGGGNVALPASTPCPGTVGNPGLGPLANNGGPTETMALHPGSNAIDRVPAPCGTDPDQRGIARPQGAGCDAGAYELAPPAITSATAGTPTLHGNTVTVALNPNDRATTWEIQYGASTAYGSTSAVQTIAAGAAPVSGTATLTGLENGATIHYRVVATSADGTTTGADATFTTPAFAGVKITTRGLKVSHGRLSVKVGCPKGGGGACVGTLTLAASTPLAHSNFTIPAGRTRAVVLRITTSALKRLRAGGKHGLAVTLSAISHDTAGLGLPVAVNTKLKA